MTSKRPMSKGPRFAAIACALVLGVTLCGCDASDPGDASASTDASTSAVTSPVQTDGEKIEVTIPESYFEGNDYAGKSADQIKERLESTLGTNATQNDDGSWTVTMTRDGYEKFTANLRESVQKTLDEMAGSDSFPNVAKVEYADDFSTATITLTTNDLGTADMFDCIAVGIPACTYQQVAGRTVRCTVTTVGADGTTLDTTVIPDDLTEGGVADGTKLPDLSVSDLSLSDLSASDLPDVSSSDVESARDTVSELVSTVMSTVS